MKPVWNICHTRLLYPYCLISISGVIKFDWTWNRYSRSSSMVHIRLTYDAMTPTKCWQNARSATTCITPKKKRALAYPLLNSKFQRIFFFIFELFYRDWIECEFIEMNFKFCLFWCRHSKYDLELKYLSYLNNSQESAYKHLYYEAYV